MTYSIDIKDKIEKKLQEKAVHKDMMVQLGSMIIDRYSIVISETDWKDAQLELIRSPVNTARFKFFSSRIKQLGVVQQVRYFASPLNVALCLSIRVYGGRVRAFAGGFDKHLSVSELIETTKNLDGFSESTVTNQIKDLVEQKHFVKMSSFSNKKTKLIIPTTFCISRRCAQVLLSELIVIATYEKNSPRFKAFTEEWVNELKYPEHLLDLFIEQVTECDT